MSRANSEKGFSLIEVVIAMAVSGILLIALVRFFKDSRNSLDLQEQIGDRNQTMVYVMRRLGDRLMEAGANLPDSGWQVVSAMGSGDTLIKIGLNPMGGVQQNSASRTGYFLPVDDCKGFKTSNNVLVVYQAAGKSAEMLKIDKNYNTGKYVAGILDTNGRPDTLKFTVSRTYASGDVFYSYQDEAYRLVKKPGKDSGSLYINSLLLAEGLDSVKISFYDASGTASSNWKNIRSAKLVVGARTTGRDPSLKGKDKFRHSVQSLDFRLRNR